MKRSMLRIVVGFAFVSASVFLAMPIPALAQNNEPDGSEYSLEPFWGQRFSCYTNIPSDPMHSHGCQEWSQSDFGTGFGPFTRQYSITQTADTSRIVVSVNECDVSYIQPEKANKAVHFSCFGTAKSCIDEDTCPPDIPGFDLVGGHHGRIDVRTGEYVTSYITTAFGGLITEVICTPDPDCVDPVAVP